MATQIPLNSTSVIRNINLGVAGLAYNTSGLIMSTICDNEATPTIYSVASSNLEDITTLGTYAAPTASKARFKVVDATNHPCLYQIQFADARFAVPGAKQMVVSFTGATLPATGVHYEIDLSSTTTTILADTNELQTDWVNGGRLDTILDTAAAGNATLANQTAILALLAAGVQNNNPVPDAGTIQLIKGDTYSGAAGLSPKLSWTTSIDYTAATSITLIIYDDDDTSIVYFTGAAVAASSTLVTVSMTADFLLSLSFTGCPLTFECSFALFATTSGSDSTIARGKAYIFARSD